MNPTDTLSLKLAELFKQGTQQAFNKGETILRTDLVPPGVFRVNGGYIKVYSLTEAGGENLHIIYGPGSILPIIWAVTGRLRQVFYEAMDEVSVSRISRHDFLVSLEKDPEVANAVLCRVIEMFNVYADQVDNLEYTHSRSRIVYRLLKLAEEVGNPHGTGILFQAPIRHHDIANSSNCSRETVSREMEKLEKKGLIGYVDHHILIRDPQGLERELLGS